jgi:hypothetical protein
MPKGKGDKVRAGKLGGSARAKTLTAEERSGIARKGGRARAKKLGKAEMSRIAKRAIAARWKGKNK